MNNVKKIPVFNNEADEKSFWEENDSSEYLDWGKAEKVSFSKLKPSAKTISLRLPESVLEDLKILSRKMDFPYQSLIKIFLKKRLNKELRHFS